VQDLLTKKIKIDEEIKPEAPGSPRPNKKRKVFDSQENKYLKIIKEKFNFEKAADVKCPIQ
jgi:hypothetical protein